MNLLKNKPTTKKYVFQSLVALAVIALVLAFDLVTKEIVASHIPIYDSVTVINGFLYFTYTTNTGGAWSVGGGSSTFMTVVIVLTFIALAVFTLLIFFPDKRKNMLFIVAMSMITAGAAGNLVDRLYLGYVRDFLDVDFGKWTTFPIFNVADFFLVTGVCLLILYIIIYIVKAVIASQKAKAAKKAQTDNPDNANDKTDGEDK